MEWADVVDLIDYWGDWPPTHEILKMVHEVKRAPKAEAASFDADDPSGIGSMIGRFADGQVRVDDGGTAWLTT